MYFVYCALSFCALTLLVGWQEGHLACKKTEWWGAGVVICLERGAHLHMAQLMPLPLTVSLASLKSRLVLPFWYRLTQVVLEKGPLNGCVCVCVYCTYIRITIILEFLSNEYKKTCTINNFFLN